MYVYSVYVILIDLESVNVIVSVSKYISQHHFYPNLLFKAKFINRQSENNIDS